MAARVIPRRRFFQGGLGVAGVSLMSGCGWVPLPSQRAARVRRIGYLEFDSRVTARLFDELREGLRNLDYVEGQDIQIEYRDAEGRAERLPAMAAELLSSSVELIAAPNPDAALAASQATSVIPIVAISGNVLATGLVKNIARPEANITGVSTNSAEVAGKWIELLKETVPTLSRLAVAAGTPPSGAVALAVQRACESLRIQPTVYAVFDLERLPAVLATARAEGADGVVFLPDGVLGAARDSRFGGTVLESRLPAAALDRSFAVNGGLLAYGPNLRAITNRAASYVDKILRGAKPGDLPVELPTTFDLVVNLKSAQALGLTIPQSVLQQVTEVIQ